MIQEKINVLSEKLDRFIADFQTLREERDTLLKKNDTLIDYIHTLEEDNKSLKSSMDTARRRMENLLSKFG